MKQYFKNDILAGVVVFLVALPLCLGIALSSNVPATAGILSGVIGGIVVGFLSQSHVSVSGASVGLVPIVLASITKLGDFQVFLLAVVIAGVIQIFLGILKGGIIANYIPTNVIKGLLTSIGIILILKQIPHAVGLDIDSEDDFSFYQKNGENTFSELAFVQQYFNVGAIIISLLSLFIIVLWNRLLLKRIKFIPSSLFIIFFGVMMNAMYSRYFPSLQISSEHLISMPTSSYTLDSLFTLPNFNQIINFQVWIVAFTIAIVASMETLINLEAVANIDPYKRYASPNRELIAQGVGNVLSGLVGGLPVSSIVIRGSVNINADAKTKLSTIIHGFLFLVSLIVLSSFINQIPLASLACILMATGYKLVKFRLFQEMYKKGLNQFIPFVVTILSILFTDLLTGVIIGLSISIFYILKSNFHNPFLLQREILHVGEVFRFELPNHVSFLNKASIKETLMQLPKHSKVIIDATNTNYVEDDVLEIFHDFKNVVSLEKKIKLNIIGLKKQYNIEDHIEFVNVLDKTSQEKMTSEQILEVLKNGNERFINGRSSEKYLKHQVNATALGQNPFAVILSCIDSRTTTEHIFDLGLGDIFSVRIAGNILNSDILGSMEFAVQEAGVKLIVVLGHTKCGAIMGACNQVKFDNFTSISNKIENAIAMEKTVIENRNGKNIDFVNKVSEQNVFYVIEKIKEGSNIIKNYEKDLKVKIVGAMYDIEIGKVDFYK